METSTKFIISGAVGALLFIVLLLIGLTPETPSLSVTVDYPSLVFKPSEFNIELLVKNTVSSTLVKNKISIDAGDIKKLDEIPSDCERLTEEERICEESLSFQVINSTSSGSHKIKVSIDSVNYLNLPILKNFIEYSKGSSVLEFPINVQVPEVETLSTQSEVNYSKVSTFLLIVIFLFIALIVFLFVVIILFAPQLWEFFSKLW